MSRTVPVFATVVVAILAGVVFTSVRNSNSTGTQTDTDESAIASDASLNSAAASETINASVEVKTTVEKAEIIQPDATDDSLADGSPDSTHASSAEPGFAQSLGRGYVNDETLIENANALRNDPALLAAVLDEFLAETDEQRLGRLRQLLGQLDDPALVGVAETMVFSGNPVSADAGLDLLRDISADVPEARLVALDVLSSTQDPELLVGATNVMASPGAADSAVTQQVVSSMSSLVQHPDARVRRLSYSALARWSNDPSVTPTLLQGLNDDDPMVRRNTVYGLVGYPHADASVVEALLQTAESSSDTLRARRGAILALKGMSLDDSQGARFQAVQTNVK